MASSAFASLAGPALVPAPLIRCATALPYAFLMPRIRSCRVLPAPLAVAAIPPRLPIPFFTSPGEKARLRLVALAAEIATLSERVAEELARSGNPRAAALQAECRGYVHAALMVLGPEFSFDALSAPERAQLEGALLQDRMRIRTLRHELQHPSSPDSWF